MFPEVFIQLETPPACQSLEGAFARDIRFQGLGSRVSRGFELKALGFADLRIRLEPGEGPRNRLFGSEEGQRASTSWTPGNP